MSDPSVTSNPPNSDDQTFEIEGVLKIRLGPDQLAVLAASIPAEDMVPQLVHTIINEPDLGQLFALSLVRTMNLPQNAKVKQAFRKAIMGDVPDSPA